MKLEPTVGINPKCLFLQRDISNEIDLDKHKAQGEKYRIRKENNHKIHVQSRKMGSITSIYEKKLYNSVCLVPARQRQEILRAGWPASLGKLVSSSLVRNPGPKNKVNEEDADTSLWALHAHVKTHTNKQQTKILSRASIFQTHLII